MEPPETRYATSGDVHIAYPVVGEGPLDLVFVPSLTHHIELVWENPPQARFFRAPRLVRAPAPLRQARNGDVGPVRRRPDTGDALDDIRAVMDVSGSERAALIGLGDGGPLAALFAATYPERTIALVLIHTAPRFTRSPEFPWLPTRAERERQIEEAVRTWADCSAVAKRFVSGSPSATEEERQGFGRVIRLSVSPGAAASYLRMNLDVDIRDVLPLIRVPTLVVQRTEISALDVREGRYNAEHIPGARLVELPGCDFAPQLGDTDRLLGELDKFLSDVAAGGEWQAEPDRVLATVLFTDIVDATTRAAGLGDSAWRELLHRHHDAIRGELGRFRGNEVDTAGDGSFATFDGPARAIRCACAIRDSLRDLDLEVRAGLHTGECERDGERMTGIAVHIGARVAAMAGPGEVLVSRTVKDLVAGSGIELDDRGEHELKGVPGDWQLFSVRDA
jgi:class 3 adenylate cyclase